MSCLILKYLRIKYGLNTYFKYPESRLFTCNLLNIRYDNFIKSENQ
nr:MAG TPA: hypothetical protein [Bacteriophage sp.]